MKLNILFLGASKRTSLIERFLDSAKELNIDLNIFSCEKDESFCPISHLANIIPGPKFESPKFQEYLKSTIEKFDIHIVIPNMDSATVALSKFKKENQNSKIWCLVSDYELCQFMEDKKLSNQFFLKNNITVPLNNPGLFPKIVKPIHGFGSKGIIILNNEAEYNNFIQDDISGFIIQDFIQGSEVTVDFYASPKKGLLGYVIRDRIEVSDGEIMIGKTRPASPLEKKLIENICAIPGWEGCITLQYIINHNNEPFLIEINPRFGGGATCAIEAGLDMPKYIMAEYLGIEFNKPNNFKNLIMARARRDFFHEY